MKVYLVNEWGIHNMCDNIITGSRIELEKPVNAFSLWSEEIAFEKQLSRTGYAETYEEVEILCNG